MLQLLLDRFDLAEHVGDVRQARGVGLSALQQVTKMLPLGLDGLVLATDGLLIVVILISQEFRHCRQILEAVALSKIEREKQFSKKLHSNI